MALHDDRSIDQSEDLAMTDIEQIFVGPLAKHVFITGGVLLAVATIYTADFVRKYAQPHRGRLVKSRRTALAVAIMAMVAMLIGSVEFTGGASGRARQHISLSIGDLTRHVDIRSLPNQQVAEPY
jgi:hypothetical protein